MAQGETLGTIHQRTCVPEGRPKLATHRRQEWLRHNPHFAPEDVIIAEHHVI